MAIARRLRRPLASASPVGMTFDDWKPIVRCVVAAWCGLLLMLVPESQKVLGQASFLVLVVSAVNPPNGPIVRVVYDSLYSLIFICISWAIYVVSSRIAIASRVHVYPADSLAIPNVDNYHCSSTPQECFTTEIFAGSFVEGRSSLVFACFLYLGAAFYLYLKFAYPARLMPIIFGSIALNVTMANGPLFPYFYPELGQVFFFPMACQCAINIACSVLFWPRSMNHAYIKQIQGLLASIKKLTNMQIKALDCDPSDAVEWALHATIKDQVRATRAGLAAFGPTEDLLVREFHYCRLGSDDLRSLTTACRDIVLKMGGMSLFYDLVTSHMQSWHDRQRSGVMTPARPSSDVGADSAGRETSGSETATATQSPSRITTPGPHGSPGDLEASNGVVHTRAQLDIASEKLRESRQDPHGKSRHAHFKVRTPVSGLLHDRLHHVYKPVGVFEMHDYTAREAKFPKKLEIDYLLKMMKIVSGSSRELLDTILAALETDSEFLQLVNKDRFVNRFFFLRKSRKNREELIMARDDLRNALEAFQSTGRLKMIEPYDSIAGHNYGNVPHRPLLRMFYLEFHLMRFATATLKLTQKCLDMNDKRPSPRWHYPKAFFFWTFGRSKKNDSGRQDTMDEQEYHADTNPNMPSAQFAYETEVRDPDHGPPRHFYHLIGRALVKCVKLVQNPSVFFALKAAALFPLVALPAFLRRTAGWYYHERGLWVLIMASFTQAPFTGDTIFSFIWRIIGTFIGTILGCAVWYIGNGSGRGQPFGLAAIMAVAYVPLMYVRIKWLYINQQPAIILVITFAIVIGYSWQDGNLPSAVDLGVGWDVAWRRFTVVIIGITAAFIWSFVPKPTTGRQVVRQRLASGAFDIGKIFVLVSNFGRNPLRSKSEEEEIRRLVVRANAKLLLLNLRLDFATYEPPIQGPWPRDKYKRILALQRELLDLMVSWCNNLSYMEKNWIDPMLRRSGWFDRDLISDCLAVIFMTANAIKTGSALPQLVPCPLIDRFYAKMDMIQETQAEGSLPKTVTRETLEDPGYASFAVGSVMTFSIVHRIDALLLVTKELVGEVWQTSHFIEQHEYNRMNVV